MQKTDFPFEYIIGEDCSTDGTRQIVLEYARRHPDKIRVLTAESNVGMQANGMRCLRASRGKYIAVCEGDDCWTDPLKLQKQVALLEAHPDYALCVTAFRAVNCETHFERDVILVPPGIQVNQTSYTFTLMDTFNTWVTQPLTAVYRNKPSVVSECSTYRYGKDVNLFYHLLRDGSRGLYLTQVMAMYRMHKGGVYSSKTISQRTLENYRCYRELHERHSDEFTRKKLFVWTGLLLSREDTCEQDVEHPKSRAGLLFQMVRLVRTGQELRYVGALLLPASIRRRLRRSKGQQGGGASAERAD